MNDSNYKIKIVGMMETPTKITVRSFMYSRLELTQSTKDNMKKIQSFRMGKDTPGTNDKTVGPVIVILFSTTTVQAVLNVAKGC